jgi:hypothetical protein
MMFGFILGPVDEPRHGTAPVVAWSMDGGAWHGLPIAWQPQPTPNMSYWGSNDTGMTDLRAGSTHTMRIRVQFRADNPDGSYHSQVGLGSRDCGITALGWDSFSFGYATEFGPTGCCAYGGTGGGSGSASGGGSAGHGGGTPRPTGGPSRKASPPPKRTTSATPSASAASPSMSLPSAAAEPGRLVAAADPVPSDRHEVWFWWLTLVGALALAGAATAVVLRRRARRVPDGG